MKVIIAGSRELNDIHLIDEAYNKCPLRISEIVSGGARGIDKQAILFAKQLNISYVEFMADWETQGKKAGILRNFEMAKYADALIAIWDGKSLGTLNMINTMHKLQKPIYVLSVWK